MIRIYSTYGHWTFLRLSKISTKKNLHKLPKINYIIKAMYTHDTSQVYLLSMIYYIIYLIILCPWN